MISRSGVAGISSQPIPPCMVNSEIAPRCPLSPFLRREGMRTHFTRVNVSVLQNTAATHPDRSSVFLVFTVTVPEYSLPSARL